jgi:hypothetical protein
LVGYEHINDQSGRFDSFNLAPANGDSESEDRAVHDPLEFLEVKETHEKQKICPIGQFAGIGAITVRDFCPGSGATNLRSCAT